MSDMNPMLSQTTEYALRAILYLARLGGDEPVSAEVIAGALGAPRNYLSKTLNSLAKRGIVSGTRGPFGGFRLAVVPETLSIAHVIHAFVEPRPRGTCLLGGQPCDASQPCTVHFRWKAVAAELWAPLNETTIADLLRGEIPDRFIAGATAGVDCPVRIPPPGEPGKDER